MVVFCNAKVNLGLYVTGRRTDGYHDIETVFYPIPLSDALEVVDSPHEQFYQTGLTINIPPEKNLITKALRLLESRYKIPPLEVHLLKRTPFGAGLGGGSSNAAFMLRLVNDHCRLGLSAEELEKLALLLGSDCPFFIRNRPVFATGRGNKFTPIGLSLKDYYLCLVKPDVSVSTALAYSMITPMPPVEPSLPEIVSLPVKEWKNRLANHFEDVVFNLHPVVGEIKEELYGAGALYAAMSGSGSAVFGLFEQEVCLKDRFPDCFVWEGWMT